MLDGKRVSIWRGVAHLVGALGRLAFSPKLWLSVALLLAVGLLVAGHADRLTPVTLVVDGASRLLRTQCATVEEVLRDAGVSVSEWDKVTPGLEEAVQPRMTVAVQHAHPVSVVADGVARVVHTHSWDVGTVLREAGLELREGDQLRIDGTLAQGERDGPFAHLQVERATLIRLDDGGVEQALRTTASTVGRALAEAGIRLYTGDRVYPDLNTSVNAGLNVRIVRGIPVQVAVDGRTVRTRTHAKSVGEALAETGVSLVGQDFSVPALDALIRDDLSIRVVRVREEMVVEQEVIPFTTEYVPDNELELDHRRVDDVGANGIRSRRYKTVYHDGQQVDHYLEDEWVAQDPQSREIVYGTRIVVRTMDTPEGEIEYWRRIRVWLSAYTEASCGKEPGHPTYGITRLGWEMRRGIIAVDPTVIALRSDLYVPTYGLGVAGDTGGMIKGRHIDLGFEVDGYVHYWQWGEVYVLTPVPPASQIRWILPDWPRFR